MMSDHDKDRSAISGRYVSDEEADANPDTTVSERVEPPRKPEPVLGDHGPSPGDWRCNAPDAVCVNQRDCDRADRCKWETWEACNPPRPGTV